MGRAEIEHTPLLLLRWYASRILAPRYERPKPLAQAAVLAVILWGGTKLLARSACASASVAVRTRGTPSNLVNLEQMATA